MFNLLCENEVSYNSFCRQEFKTLFDNIDLSELRKSFKSKFSTFRRDSEGFNGFKNNLYKKDLIVVKDWKLFSEKEIRENFDSEKKPFCDFIDAFKEMRFTTILKSSKI